MQVASFEQYLEQSESEMLLGRAVGSALSPKEAVTEDKALPPLLLLDVWA
jgi:hypothetical protein